MTSSLQVILVLAFATSPWPRNGLCVKAPSASASTSLTSSLLSLSADGEGSKNHLEDSLDSELAKEECKVKNLKQQERMVMAKLDAHRCLLRDTVVPIPEPDDVIVNFIQPSHIVVPRCTGLCLERPGCECQPKKRRHVKVELIIGTNASSTSQLCTSVHVEEHRAPCKCKCMVSNCHYNKIFDEDKCQCRCKEEFSGIKAACSVDFERIWREDSCSCVCKPRICVSGHYQDKNSCQCRPVEPTCSSSITAFNNARNNNNVSANAHAPKYIGLACVVAIATAMLLSMYYLMAKRRSTNSGLSPDSIPVISAVNGGPSGTETMVGTLQRSALGSRSGTAAYTITINSSAAAAAAAASGSIDESMLPLTEDKTRF